MKKVLLYLLALPVVMLLLASCHSEEDDFIDRPDAKSLIIKGVAKTPDRQSIPNIEIKLDYMIIIILILLRFIIRPKQRRIRMVTT